MSGPECFTPGRGGTRSGKDGQRRLRVGFTEASPDYSTILGWEVVFELVRPTNRIAYRAVEYMTESPATSAARNVHAREAPAAGASSARKIVTVAALPCSSCS